MKKAILAVAVAAFLLSGCGPDVHTNISMQGCKAVNFDEEYVGKTTYDYIYFDCQGNKYKLEDGDGNYYETIENDQKTLKAVDPDKVVLYNIIFSKDRDLLAVAQQ